MKQAVDRFSIAISRLSRWEMVFWCVVVLFVWISGLWVTPLFSAQAGTVALAVFCLRVFVGHGAKAITPLGVFSLVTLLTAAFPAYVAWDDARITTVALSSAIVLTLFFTVVSALFSWNFGILSPGRAVVPGALVFAVLGLAQFAGAYLIHGSGSLPSIVVESLAVVGILLMAFGAWWHRSVWFLWLSLPIVAVLSAIYIFQIHSGQGRLRIAALGLGLLIMFSVRVRGLWVKLLSILAGPVALMVFSELRKAHQEQIHAGNSANRTGLESLTDPFVTFANLIDLHEQSRFDFQGGANLLTIFEDIAPSDWELPRAIGYELVKYWMPEKAKPGYEWFSVAANATGEWYWMWGVTGVILGSLVTGALFAALNRGLAKGVNKMAEKWWAAALFICAVTFAAGLSDLVWGGLHIYWARSIPRVAMEFATVGLVALVMFLWKKVRSQEVVESNEATSIEDTEDAEPITESDEADEIGESNEANDPEPVAQPEPASEPEPAPEPTQEPEFTSAPRPAPQKSLEGAGIAIAAGAAVGTVAAIVLGSKARRKAKLDERAEKWLRALSGE